MRFRWRTPSRWPLSGSSVNKKRDHPSRILPNGAYSRRSTLGLAIVIDTRT